jgi:hypothetical protein
MKIKILSGYPTYNFKLERYDIALLASFIFCCVTVLWLAYSVSEPVKDDKIYTNSIVWTITGIECYAYGLKWPARNGICYMKDIEK